MGKIAWAALSGVLSWVLFNGAVATATMTITPLNFTVPVPSPTPYTQGTLTFNYLVQGFPSYVTPLDNGAFLDPAIAAAPLDLSKNFGYSRIGSTGANTPFQGGTADTELNNAIGVKISTTVPIQTGQNPVVMIQLSGSGSTVRYVPLAGNDQGRCNDQRCLAKDIYQRVLGGIPSASSNLTAPFYAVRVFGPTFTVYFYPHDICADNPTLTASICEQGQLVDPGTGMKKLDLNFVIQNIPNALPTSQPSGSPVDSTSNPVSFNFQTTASTFDCPDLSTVTIRPDDGRVYIDASPFTLTGTAEKAQGVKFVTVIQKMQGNTAVQPVLDATFKNDGVNSKFTDYPGSYGNSLYFASGFENSTGAQTNQYYLGFMIQDAAGIYTPPSPRPGGNPAFPPIPGQPDTQTCNGFGPISTAAVNGFANPEVKGCFIATAAFQSADAGPVRMLREFRDQVLLASTVGESFVNWYYSWSPGAARWLDDHPGLRIPVLLGLSKLELVAWLLLHPGVLLLLVFAGLGLSLVGLRGRKRGKLHAS